MQSVRKDPWTEAEDMIILSLVQYIGCKWATIAKALSASGFHRTDFAVGNHYHQTLKRKQQQRQEKEHRRNCRQCHPSSSSFHRVHDSAEHRVQIPCLLNPV